MGDAEAHANVAALIRRIDPYLGCVGVVDRVYRWRGEQWRVLVRWQGAGPRNVLIENVETGERVVRPFRGLRKVPDA